MDPYLAPDKLLTAYACGIFPMADDAGELQWLAPDPRAIIELNTFRAPRSLRAIYRSERFTVTVNKRFDDIMAGCADRPEGTWISDEIKQAYGTLHRLGFAHSVEVWNDGRIAGGLYGVAIGGAFFGESMVHRVTDASKVALVHLIERMKERGMTLLDVQFMTDHLNRLGAIEISRDDYENRLAEAIALDCSFAEPPVADEAVESDEHDSPNDSERV